MLFLPKKKPLRDAASSPRACKIQFCQRSLPNQANVMQIRLKSKSIRDSGIRAVSGVKNIPTFFSKGGVEFSGCRILHGFKIWSPGSRTQYVASCILIWDPDYSMLLPDPQPGPRIQDHRSWILYPLHYFSGVTIKPNRFFTDLGEFCNLCRDFGP